MQQAGTDTATVLRDHVRVALEDAGLMVVGEAADGAHALTQAAARDPDVVLMDLRMPGMDGIQAAQAPRGAAAADARGAVDRGGDAQLASAIRKSGAHAGVAKGIRTVELVATARSVCEVCPRPRQDEASGWICGDRTDRSKRRYQQGASAWPAGSRLSFPRRARSQLT